MIALSFTKESAQVYDISDYYSFFRSLGFWESAFIQSVLLFVLLLIFLFFLKNDFNKNFKYLFWIIIIDVIISAQLNIPLTATSDSSTSALKKKLSILPEKFHVPQNRPALMYSDSSGQIGLFWKNLGIFYKRPQFDGYNPFHMKGYSRLTDEPGVFYPVLKNNLAFLSDNYSFFADTIRDTVILKSKPNHLFIHEKFKQEIKAGNLQSSGSDQAEIILFRPDQIKIKSHTSFSQFLTLMQHDYPGWNVSVDGKHVDHFTSDYMFISILLPAGDHLVEYTFENKTVSAGLIISIVSILVCLALLIAKRKIK